MESKPGSPFKKPLEPHIEHAGNSPSPLRQFENNPSLVVRGASLESVNGKNNRLNQFTNIEEAAAVSKRLHEELSEKYGILIAPTNFVVASNERGRPRLYTITENIEATKIDTKIIATEDLEGYKRELKDTFEKVAAYYEDKFGKNEFFLADIWTPGQYAYGKKKGDEEKHLYLVDTDPRFTDSKRILQRVIWDFQGILTLLEIKYDIEIDYKGLRVLIPEEPPVSPDNSRF